MSVSCIFSSFFCFSVAFAFHRLPHRFAGNSRGVGDFTKCCHRNNYNFHQKILQKSMRIRLHNEGDKEVDSTKSQRGYSIKLLNTIEELSPQEWNGLLKADSSPFLEYHWIHALEKSGCASETEGWKALHVAVFDSLPNDDRCVIITSSKFASLTEIMYKVVVSHYAVVLFLVMFSSALM
jgi:hypothetical protein